MSEFKWHLMADEKPEEGECDFIVMGHKGGLKLAKGFRETPGFLSESEFYCTKGGHGLMTIWSEDVYAWAEIPILEVKQ